jgi:hypothetical protein
MNGFGGRWLGGAGIARKFKLQRSELLTEIVALFLQGIAFSAENRCALRRLV